MSTDRSQADEGLREPQSLSRQISALLAADIVSGRIGLGEPFASSEEIVNRFSVSRTVARETVQALAILGMVNVRHGKRTEVCPPEEWDILSSVVQEAMRREGKAEPLLRDLYEFRLLIEPQAAAWMAKYAGAEEVAELSALADRMERLAHDDAAALIDLMGADRTFHDLISRASDNQVVAAVSRDIREVIGTLWGFSALDAAAAVRVVEQHQLIAGAVARRDASAAAGAMREHLLWAAQADLHGVGEPSGLRLFSGTTTD